MLLDFFSCPICPAGNLYKNKLHLGSWHEPVFRYESHELLLGLIGWHYTEKWLKKYVLDIRSNTVEMKYHLKQSINSLNSGNYYWRVMTVKYRAVGTCMIQTCSGDICYAHVFQTCIDQLIQAQMKVIYQLISDLFCTYVFHTCSNQLIHAVNDRLMIALSSALGCAPT